MTFPNHPHSFRKGLFSSLYLEYILALNIFSYFEKILQNSDIGFAEGLVPSTRNLMESLSNPAALKVSMFLITSKCFYWKFKLKELQNDNCKVFLCL